MKILLLSALYAPHDIGGTERSVQYLAEALVRDGHEVVVVTLSSLPGMHIGSINRVKIYYLGLKNLFWIWDGKPRPRWLRLAWHILDAINLPMARALTPILEVEQPDVVHTNSLAGFSPLAWKVIKARGYPLVHTVQDYFLMCPYSAMFRDNRNCATPCFDCRPFATFSRRLANHPDAVVGSSRFVLERHLSQGYFTETPIKEVVYNPYMPPDGKMGVMPQVGHNAIRFGYLGRLERHKGLDVLLDVICRLPMANWSLAVAGKGSQAYEAHLERIVQMPKVTFLGWVEPEVFFPQIDVLIVPSLWHEPVGRAIFEAYAYQRPVLGARRGTIPELINVGKTGFLFDPDVPVTLSEHLAGFISGAYDLATMQMHCWQQSKRFLSTHILQSMAEIYVATVAHSRHTQGRTQASTRSVPTSIK